MNRQLALQLTCEAFASLSNRDDDLVAKVIATCREHACALQAPNSQASQQLRDIVLQLKSKIEFNRRDPGETEAEQKQTHQLLRELRQDYAEALAKLANHEAALSRKIIIPTADDVISILDELRQMFLDSCEAEDDQQLRLARRLIEELIDDKIELYQQGERKQGHGWLQGRVKVNVVSVLVKKLASLQVEDRPDDWKEISIDYKRPMLIDEQSETGKRLWDDGLLHVEIAEQMGCIPPYVTKLIQHWHDKRGVPRPNNKKRRKSLKNKQQRTPHYRQIANQVHELMDAGHSNLEIARQTKTSDTNVAKAIKWWHKTRELPVPTAADRRNQKLRRAMSMLDGGALLTDVANKLDYSPRGLKLALDKYAKDNGDATLDLRSRRGNAKSGASANGKARPADSDAA